MRHPSGVKPDHRRRLRALGQAARREVLMLAPVVVLPVTVAFGTCVWSMRPAMGGVSSRGHQPVAAESD